MIEVPGPGGGTWAVDVAPACAAATSKGGFRPHDGVGVVIIGAGVAGLVTGAVLERLGVETIVLERCSRQEIETRPRAGLLGPGPVAVLERNGLADGLHAAGSPHHDCEFRHQRRSFVVEYAEMMNGLHHTVYPQQRLVADLLRAYLEAGGTAQFNVTDIVLGNLTAERPSVAYTDGVGARHRLASHYVAGCDGHHGVSRAAVPAEALVCIEQPAGEWAWLAVLAAAPPSTERIIYAVAEDGFAGHMLRDDRTSRFYLQVPADTDPADWSADRIWSELHERLAVDADWKLTEGPLVGPPSVVSMNSVFFEPMRFGRLLLAGDAARRVPPAAAKGAGLAIADGASLAEAIGADLHRSDTVPLAAYSDACRRRAWVSQEASTMLLRLLHVEHNDPFARRLQDVRLEALRTSRTAAAAFAEHYVSPI